MEKGFNYARFYTLLKKLPGADKETLVCQYTRGRTVHLHETSIQEYNMMCNDMERVAGYDERRETLRKELRGKRSVCLKLMQKAGIDTTDWQRVNDFCRHPRIAGKAFAQLNVSDLDVLQTKLRSIMRKGGLNRANQNNQTNESNQSNQSNRANQTNQTNQTNRSNRTNETNETNPSNRGNRSGMMVITPLRFESVSCMES